MALFPILSKKSQNVLNSLIKSISLWAQRVCSLHGWTGSCLIMFSLRRWPLLHPPPHRPPSLTSFLFELLNHQESLNPRGNLPCASRSAGHSNEMSQRTVFLAHWLPTAAPSSALPRTSAGCSWCCHPTDWFRNSFLEPRFGGRG